MTGPIARLAAAVLLAATLASCGDSALTIRIVFPDDGARRQAQRLLLLAIDRSAKESCSTVLAQGEAIVPRALAKADLDLRKGEELVFPQLPMRELLLVALVFDGQGAFLRGCSSMSAQPGDTVEVVIRLNCAPGRMPCLDLDGDGVPADKDCDDDDPCRSPNIKEAASLCGGTDGFALPKSCQDKLARENKKWQPPYCSDGVDQDCSGQDVACGVDNDCDGFPPPADCDDSDPLINPLATEVCGDGKDNNCNGVIDEGCVPCDVDGDGHALPGATDPLCKEKPQDDTDDYDAGINPDTTKGSGGAEGGTVEGALRGHCSYDAKKEKNGLRPRDVDHDGDGKAAKDDGCPPENCDKDGDGFPGPQCSPPKSQEDCNDNDPTIFPGAPDRCGDGIAQNCVSDTPCDCDKDGDTYCPPADCDDTNPAVHPWATEVCDQRDNDCDGLIDEGNPDASGVPIPTNVKKCNDDNDGMCGCLPSTQPPCDATKKALSGICACSRTTPNSSRDAKNRVACAGEDLAELASPRCFGATQPQIERCVAGDFNCDGHDVLPGEAFDSKGMTCGTDVGSCKAGKVVDCDLSKTVANVTLVKQWDPKFNDHWVCDGKLPFPEVCNGLNDACTSSTAPTNEQDKDSDKYISCSGCTTSDADPRKNLAPSLKGCDDCDDYKGSVHPGATELCNGVDDNCANGLTDDGAGECSGSTPTCCGSSGCIDISSNFARCGSCTGNCNSDTSDHCENSKCVCGSTGGACGGGLNCQSQSCKCIVGGLCSGCCTGTTCHSPSVSYCGQNGSSCKNCNDGNSCTSDSCTSSGNCSNPAISGSCSGGICRSGNCCTGCWDGSSCLGGTNVNACGNGGGSCVSCGGAVCRNPACNGSCYLQNQADGTACSSGKCYAGSCCTGCWNGTCQPGTDVAACGTGGNTCVDCTGYTCNGSGCQ